MSFDNFSRPSLPYTDVYYGFMNFYAPISLLLIPLGVVANIINIIVFFKTGSKDNVTISLLALSMSDLAFLVVISPHVAHIAVDHLVQYRLGIRLKWLVDPTTLLVPFYWYAFLFYDTSTLITAYISVVRCACIALPFKVKDMFTSRRALITFLVFFICVFFLRLPMFIKKRFVRISDKLTNSSKVVVRDFEDGGLAYTINDIVSRNIQPWSCFIIVIACLVVMVSRLRASAKFRSTSSSNGPSGVEDRPLSTPKTRDECDAKMESKATKDEKSKSKVISTRDVKVLRSVILVAVIFVVCQVPFMTYSLARRLNSKFDHPDVFGKLPKYVFLFAIGNTTSKLCAFVNSTVNILVYYNHNSRYRQCLRAMMKIENPRKQMK